MALVQDLLRRFFALDLVIYAAIAVVTVIAIIRCLFPLRRATSRLRRAGKIIITENKQNKDKYSWRDLGFLGDRMSGTWADFLQNTELRQAHGETCDVSAYVNEETVIDTAGGVGLAEITPGLLTSLGILGTFLGLVRGLSGLQLSAANTEQLLAAMEQLIGGMSTAFLTSIAGVSCSLIFTLLNNHETARCQKAIDRFCEIFSLYAMPKPVSDQTELLSLQKEQTAYLRQAAEEIGQKLAGQMEESIMRAMLPVQRSMDNFILAATKAQIEGMDRITQVFVQRMNVALGNEFDHLRQVLADTGREQVRTQQEMKAATEAIAHMTQDVINMHQLSQGVIEHFEGFVQEMQSSRLDLGRQTEQFAKALDQSAHTTQLQASVLEQIQKTQQSVNQNQQQYIATTERFLAAAQEQTKEMNRQMELAGQKMQEQGEALSQMNRETGESLNENLQKTTALLDESVTSSITQMNTTLNNMKEIAQTMPQLMSQSRERYADQVDKFVEALVKLQKNMEALEKAMPKGAEHDQA